MLSEIESQRRKEESLDTKAGIALGFSGAFVALSANSLTVSVYGTRVIGIITIISGGLSALWSLWSFWPKKLETLDAERARDEALGQIADEVLRVALLDTRFETLKANARVIELKLRRLRVSLSLLLVSILLFGSLS